MSPERWQRIKSVYGEALEREGADREAFLAEACGEDLDLRAEVDSLLRAKDASGLESPLQAPDWSGRDLGPFHLIEKIGEGGMGSVWKARDAKLGRAVALKFVAAHSLSDEAQQRLLREAQASAALDHPNICHVYGIHEEQGQTFIAMAYIDGPSLADKIRERPLPLSEALDIAIQIAEGLQEAHEKGIVHRDIKPANVMLTAKGQVKIMDFGLASLADRSKLTKTGTALGTLAYMAPEQLEGQEVDRRADLWALGCALYEMLTQKTPFGAEYEQAIAYSIWNEEPEPVTAQRSGLPTGIDQVIAKSLAKVQDERYQHADDLLVDLRRLRKADTSRTVAAQPVQTTAEKRKPDGRLLLGFGAGAMAAGIAAALLASLASGPDTVRDRQVVRLSVPPPEGTVIRSFELSPDGRHLAFVAEGEHGVRLWLRSFHEAEAKPVEGADNLEPRGAPFWSPDSRYIGFFADRKLKRVGILGEPPVEIADANAGRGGAWNEEGVILFAPEGFTARELLATTADGAPPRPATALLDQAGRRGLTRWPYFLPDGDRFLYAPRLGGLGTDVDVRLGSLGSLQTESIARWQSHAVPVAFEGSSNGYLFGVESDVLLAYPFDFGRGSITGEGLPVANDIGFSVPMSRGMFSVSPAGAMAHSSQDELVNEAPKDVVWLDRRGHVLETLASGQPFRRVLIAPDENRAVVGVRDEQLSGGTALVLDFRNGSLFRPAPLVAGPPVGWLEDGTKFVQGNYQEISRVTADGSAAAYEIANLFRAEQVVADVSLDGKWLLIQGFSGGQRENDFFKLDLEGGAIEPYLTSPGNQSQGRFSPNGRYIAYRDDQSGRYEIYVRSFPEPGPINKVSFGGGADARWRPDGSELLFVSPDGDLMVAPVKIGPSGFSSGRPERLFTPPSPIYSYDVTADGERILATLYPPAEEPRQAESIEVVLNWDLEFARLVEQTQE